MPSGSDHLVRVSLVIHTLNEEGNIADCIASVGDFADEVLVCDMHSDDRTRDATIALLKFEQWGLAFRSLGIFEDLEEINRKVLARFTDVCGKEFSSLAGNRDRIASHLQDALGAG